MQRFSPYAILQEHASRQPEAEAIVSEDATITYGEFLERVTACANRLLHNGVTPGEVTGICIRGDIEHIVCAMALLCLGTPQMCLASRENGATKQMLARKVGVTQLVVDRTEEWMEGLRTIAAPSHDSKSISAPLSIRQSGIVDGRSRDSIVMYQNTSGSTNLPKTFGLTSERLLVLAGRCAADSKEQRVLRTGSIEIDANRLHRLSSLIAGTTSVFLRHVTLASVVARCQRAAVTSLVMGTYRLASLIHGRGGGRTWLPDFTAVITGNARVPGPLRKELRAVLTDNIWVLYATSEVGPISRASPDQHDAFPEGVGFPAEDVTVEIVDANGSAVAPGQIGQVRIRKPGMAGNYVAGPSIASNFRDGWFYPGDLLSRGAGEPLVFHGRADDMMILNGLNIFPSAIEDALQSHPDVREAVAFAVKSRVHGDIPVAAVVLSANAQNREVAHLLDYCRQSLGIRGPRQIRVVDSIPRNPAGKPLRRELAGS